MTIRQTVKETLRRLQFLVRFAGRNIRVHPSSFVSRKSTLRVSGGGSITIGRECEIHDFAMLLTYGGDIRIGDHSSVNPFTIVYGHGGTRIGNGVRIAAHTVIIPANHVRGNDERPLYQTGHTAKGISIDDHVWIGAGCRILDGVQIGRHAIVGAGSVVTVSIPAHALAVGVPARVMPVQS
jgi:acetyltransferase-like isoleucine patch superfamily enzyme